MTKDKAKAKELLDLELNSIASKEYDPNNVQVKGHRFRSSHGTAFTPNNRMDQGMKNGKVVRREE